MGLFTSYAVSIRHSALPQNEMLAKPALHFAQRKRSVTSAFHKRHGTIAICHARIEGRHQHFAALSVYDVAGFLVEPVIHFTQVDELSTYLIQIVVLCISRVNGKFCSGDGPAILVNLLDLCLGHANEVVLELEVGISRTTLKIEKLSV